MTSVITPVGNATEAAPLTLTTADGTHLSATRFPARASLRGRIVVAGATAVPQGFYRRFAEHAAGCGFETLTFTPIDLALVEPALMTAAEIRWLNGYHAEVRRLLSPGLDPATLAWLTQATRPLAA